jgi:hypothetical protein
MPKETPENRNSFVVADSVAVTEDKVYSRMGQGAAFRAALLTVPA